MHRRRAFAVIAAAAGIALGAAGCGVSAPSSAKQPTSQPPTTTTAVTSAAGVAGSPGPTAPPTGPPATVGPQATVGNGPGGGVLLVADGHGWRGNRLDGPVPASGSCHARTVPYGGLSQPLPDPACTPGAVDGAVTQADLRTTICRAGGYTASVRPPASVTDPAKRVAMRSYGLGGRLSGYEYDHLVPLGLGGASDTRNLWPEANLGGTGGRSNAKDLVEDQLHNAVCAGRTSLAAAQAAIAANWTTAGSSLGVSS